MTLSKSTLVAALLTRHRWHQDLKPENILVTRSGAAMYDCDFLIADLGVSHFKSPTPSQPNVTDKDTFGTNVYGMSML